MIDMVKVYWVVRVVGSLACREGRHDRHGESVLGCPCCRLTRVSRRPA